MDRPIPSITDPQLRLVREHLAEMLPVRPSNPTLYRWLRPGRRSLPAIKILDRWYTTPECVVWFFNERNGLPDAQETATDPTEKAELQACGLAD